MRDNIKKRKKEKEEEGEGRGRRGEGNGRGRRKNMAVCVARVQWQVPEHSNMISLHISNKQFFFSCSNCAWRDILLQNLIMPHQVPLCISLRY